MNVLFIYFSFETSFIQGLIKGYFLGFSWKPKLAQFATKQYIVNWARAAKCAAWHLRIKEGSSAPKSAE